MKDLVIINTAGLVVSSKQTQLQVETFLSAEPKY